MLLQFSDGIERLLLARVAIIECQVVGLKLVGEETTRNQYVVVLLGAGFRIEVLLLGAIADIGVSAVDSQLVPHRLHAHHIVSDVLVAHNVRVHAREIHHPHEFHDKSTLRFEHPGARVAAVVLKAARCMASAVVVHVRVDLVETLFPHEPRHTGEHLGLHALNIESSDGDSAHQLCIGYEEVDSAEFVHQH